MFDVLARHCDGDLAQVDSPRPSIARLVLDELEERESGLAVAIEQREQRVQHLRLARLVAFPPRGMAALAPAFATVMQRSVALVVVVLISGFLPLAAGGGFCAAKPCCRNHAQPSDFSLGAHPACCNETNCSTSSPDTEATIHAKRTVTQHPVVMAALVSNVISNHPVAHFAQRFNVGSPPTQRRLAALSILLI